MPDPRITAGRGRRRNGSAYVPPGETWTITAAEAGITNGFSLRVPTLYAAGDRSLLERPRVAIVGARKASDEGRRRAAKLARELTSAGVVVVSGLALGIDEAAHLEAIAQNGRTIGVIGTPLDKAYPIEHADLQRAIYRDHLLISPFPAGTRTHPSHFPERNRVMARLSRATVIIEASDTSGSLHQASECIQLGLPVFIAQSVIDDAKLTWPKRFLAQQHVFPLRKTEDLLAVTLGG